jgi:F0F1-type ATP synthase delta subunit
MRLPNTFLKSTTVRSKAVAAEDASLIAGVRVRVGDDSYDASVSGRLQRLAERVK